MSERIPYSAPSEPVEWTTTMAGRISCLECGEWIYPRRPASSHGPYALPPECQVCGIPIIDLRAGADGSQT